MTDLFVRQRLEDAENNLCSFASKSKLSRGRIKREEPCVLRTAFQRDRDRILYSNAFRRLKHKTQVFIAPVSDHYVTRLTHTLEVSQVARTISRALNLNEDLTEAIALGHDLGHTPFGHLGEDVLNELNPGGFRHNEQSLRIVDILEKNGRGLNLTWEVKDGIANHSKSNTSIFGDAWEQVGTSEGQVVKIADIIAYINHDTADALRAGVINEHELPEAIIKILGRNSSERINTLVKDIVFQTEYFLRKQNQNKFLIRMSPKILMLANELREFLFSKVYNSKLANKDKMRAREVIYFLYEYFNDHTEALPAEYNLRNDDIARRVTDYIAGMTDHFALYKAKEITTGKKINLSLFP